MGYRSYYNLVIRDAKSEMLDDDDAADIIEELRQENIEAKYAMDESGNCLNETGWDNSDEDLKEFSLKYPELVFEMYRIGDDDEDRVYTYYKNGKMQECPAQITFDDYDETKLK